jgi:hypothetical protein
MCKTRPRLILWSLELLFIFGTRGFLKTGWTQSPTASPSQQEETTDALSCMESTCRSVPHREKLTVIGHNYIRGIVGGFEQGAGASGGLQLTSRQAIPAVTLRANFLGSTSFGRRVDFESFVPRVGSSRNHADVWFSYMRMTRNFFGIGSRIPRDFKTDFSAEQRSYQASFSRDLTNSLQGGVYSQVVDTHSAQGTRSSVPAIDTFFSATPDEATTPWVPGLFSYAKILSYGTYLLLDRRDNSENLVRGYQVYGRLSSYQGLKNKGAFEDYGWNEGEFDARGYIPLGSSRTSLALRSRGQFQTTKGGSQIPFYDLSWLGGRDYVRGYSTYRLRGRNMLMFSSELRRTVYTRSKVRGMDVFGFADSGQVWGYFRSSLDPLVLQNQKFNSSNWHSGVGGGIQYRHSRKLAGRIEIGHSNEGNLIYASMTRGF